MMRKREIFMMSALTFTAGIVIGFLLSPVKQGIVNIAGNTTGSTTKNSYDNCKA